MSAPASLFRVAGSSIIVFKLNLFDTLYVAIENINSFHLSINNMLKVNELLLAMGFVMV